MKTKEYIATFKWRLRNETYSYIFSILLAIFLYLSFTSFRIIYLLFDLTLIILLIRKPWHVLISIVIFLIAYLVFNFTRQESIESYIDGRYKVIKTFNYGVVVKHNGNNIFVRTKEILHEGDIIDIKGKVTMVTGKMQNYMFQNNIVNQIYWSKVEIIAKANSFRISFLDWLMDGPETYKKYVSLMLMGIKNSLNRDVYNLAIRTNIVHLFVISGFHISIFYLVITKIFKLMKMKEIIGVIFSIFIILFYLYLLNFPLSATRAFLLILCYSINKYLFNNKFSSLQVLFFVMMLMFVSSPRKVGSLSFILTFIATFTIMMVNEIKWKTKIKKWSAFIFFTYLSTLPIIISINNFIAPLGIVWATILAPLFSFIYTLTLFLFPFKDLMNLVYSSFDLILNTINKLNFIIDVYFIKQSTVVYIYLIPLFSILVYKVIPKVLFKSF